MLVEGCGLVPPKPVEYVLRGHEIAWLKAVAEKRDAHRRYGARADLWGRGFVKDPIFIGLCGEHAVCAYLNRAAGCDVAIDETLRQWGDGGRDIVADGIAIQVKTKATGRENLIRRVDAQRRLRALECDCFVFAQWLWAVPSVGLLGWIPMLETIQVGTHKRSRVAAHFNLRIADKHLRPMNQLVEVIRLKRALQ